MTIHAEPSSHSDEPSQQRVFLTVEEAAAVLRIGRTAAYLLARRWEDTDGADGLPVVRLGRSMRVPVHQLERLAAGTIELDDLGSEDSPASTAVVDRRSRGQSLGPRARRSHGVPTGQTSLFPEAP